MNLNEIRYIISQYTDRDFSPEEFDVLVDGEQRKHFANMTSAQNEEALRPFKVHKGIDNETPPLYVINGVAQLPSDYFSFQSAFNIMDGEPKQVRPVSDFDFDNLRQHSIEYPTLEYPVINFQNNYVRVLPKTVQYLMFEYYKIPATVHYSVSLNHGYVEYDASGSTELEWDEANQIQIIQLCLQTLGIMASLEDIKEKAKKDKT